MAVCLLQAVAARRKNPVAPRKMWDESWVVQPAKLDTQGDVEQRLGHSDGVGENL